MARSSALRIAIIAFTPPNRLVYVIINDKYVKQPRAAELFLVVAWLDVVLLVVDIKPTNLTKGLSLIERLVSGDRLALRDLEQRLGVADRLAAWLVIGTRQITPQSGAIRHRLLMIGAGSRTGSTQIPFWHIIQ